MIGGIAVIISLVYLAVQVRFGARALKATTRDSTFHYLMEWNYALMADPGLAHAWHRSCVDFSDADEHTRARMVHVMYSFFKMFENMFLHYRDGLIEEHVWQQNTGILKAYATSRGARYYLSHRRSIFDPAYVAFLDGLKEGEVSGGHVVSAVDGQSVEQTNG